MPVALFVKKLLDFATFFQKTKKRFPSWDRDGDCEFMSMTFLERGDPRVLDVQKFARRVGGQPFFFLVFFF